MKIINEDNGLEINNVNIILNKNDIAELIESLQGLLTEEAGIRYDRMHFHNEDYSKEIVVTYV